MTIDVSHLVINGCSFSYCQGLNNPSEEGWPALLGKRLNIPVVNISCKGSGNDSIMRRTIEYLYKDKENKNNPLYIVTLSQSTRREEYVINYGDKIVKNWYQLASFSTEPIEKAIYDQYDLRGIMAQEERKLLYWSCIVNTLQANNINYVISDFMPEHDTEIINYTKSHNYNLYEFLHNDENFVKNLNHITKNLPKLPCGHDGYEAQEIVAELFYQNIKEKYNNINFVKKTFFTAKQFLPLYATSDYLREGSNWCN